MRTTLDASDASTYLISRQMAFRIDNNIVRGEIDNRRKGIVRGKIWLERRLEPMTLELKGNAHPDLAGCLLHFTNLGPRFADAQLDSLASVQRGAVGDMTASRKARVLDVRLDEAHQMSKQEQQPPEHLANALYLEWFSDSNGRILIESADYELTVSPAAWQLTDEENEQRTKDAAEAMQNFLQKLTQRIEQHQRAQKDPEAAWDEHDYERFLKESDARTDKYSELLDKFGDSEQAHAKIAHEMGWDRESSDEDAAQREQWIKEMNRACEEALNEPEPEPDPHREGIDWLRTAQGGLRHPLQHTCFEGAMKLCEEVKLLGPGGTS
jgi:hypothetical protein